MALEEIVSLSTAPQSMVPLRTTSDLSRPVGLILLAAVLVLPGLGSAQVNPRFQTLWLEDGLPDKTVRAIAQDSQGFIWLGTSYGLARYDGQKMKIFVADAANPNALSNDHISDLYLDHQGRLWIATRGGLHRYVPETQGFQVARHDSEKADSLSSDVVFAVSEDGDGRLWIGTDRGLDRFDPETGRVERVSQSWTGPPVGLVRTVYRSSAEQLWIGTNSGLLVRETGSENPRRILLDRIGSTEPRVNTIVSDSEGGIWIGTHGLGLLHLDFATEQITSWSDRVTDRVVFSLTTDHEEDLWIGTMESGIYRRSSRGDWSHYQYDPGDATSLRDNAILALFVDRSDSLWAGSFQAGVGRLSLETLVFGRHDNGRNSLSCLPSPVTNDLHAIEPTTLLTATQEGLVAADVHNGSCVVFQHDPERETSLSSSAVLSIHHDCEGNIWAGTLRGLDRVSLGEKAVQRVAEIRDVPVYSLAESPAGALLVGTTNGLFRSTAEGFEPVTAPASVSLPLQINSIAFETESTAWLATNRGLYRLPENSDDLEYPSDLGEPALSAWIGAVHVDADDGVWVGVDGKGLYGFPASGHHWMPMLHDGELPDFHRFGTILSDQTGDLWVGTPRGLYRIDPGSRAVTAFRRSDGLQSDDFIGNSVFVSDSGRFYLGGRRGFNVFRPEDIVLHETAPQVSLTDFFHFNQPISAGETHRGFALPGPIDQIDEITLTHRDYVFGFEFAALFFTDPDNNRYAYKLHGFDPDWISTTAQNRRATYTNLGPGEYVFQVKASNPHGTWSEEGSRIRVVVLPAPWATWWAYTGYVLLASVATILFFAHRTAALRRRARDLQRGVQERTAIIEALLEEKDEEIATLSHEFRTPLTLILRPVKRLLQSVDEPTAREQLSMVRRNGYRLLRMVDQLLHMERFRSRQALPRKAQAVKPTIELIGQSFLELVRERDIRLEIGPVEDLWLRLARDTLEKIVLNLLSNAIKYTPEGGRVGMMALADGDHAKIVIHDTGIGIAEEHQQVIFDRYRRVLDDNSERVTGAGIGLALVKQLVEAHGGSLFLESHLGAGSTFTVRLPLIVRPGETTVQDTDAELLELELQAISEQQRRNAESGPRGALALEPGQDDRCSVLIIEDNPDMLRYVSDTLSVGYSCHQATNGEAGLAAANEQIPDLIVCDIMMPKMDGYEVIRNLKADERTSHIPTVLLTARGDRRSRYRGWQERADEYLTKPFDEQELLLRVESLLDIRKLLRERFSREFAPGAPTTDAAGKGLNPRDRTFVDKFRQMIAENYADAGLRMPQMTSLMALSERPLQRKLKSLLGHTPIEYLRAYRLEKARGFLREGWQVAKVADRTGFSSQGYFATCFKAHFGTTPSEYRDQQFA
ncbi:MAG: response regulator [Thermoanaerobaculia bacterium]|nr:response regulator [Thermoanaerobaculia bacterium]